MSYRYEEHREWLASDEGIKAVGQVIRNVEQRLRLCGGRDDVQTLAGGR